MEKELLEKFLKEEKSINGISIEVKKSRTTVLYWLKKYGLKTKNLSFKQIGLVDYNGSRCCSKCNENKDISEFYNRRGKAGSSVYCKLCTSKQVLERQRKLKQLAVEYKGGKCVKCGYNKYYGALEFHHLDPNKKDFTIAHLKQYIFNDKIKQELDKCILVCSNCHREIHGNVS